MIGTSGRLMLAMALAISSHAQDLRKFVTIPTPSAIRSLSVCGASGLAAGLARDGSVNVWRLATAELMTKRPSEEGLSALACSPDGKLLAIGRRDGSVVVTDVSGSPARTLEVAHRPIDNLAFSPDTSLLAVSVHESPAQLWDPTKGSLIAVLQTDFSGSDSMDFSPDSSLLATADADTAVRIYARTGKLRAKYSGLLLEPFALSFMPDGKQLVIGGADCSVTFLDASDGHVVRKLPQQPDPVFAVAALPDGVSLVSIHIDASGLERFTTLLWDIRSGTRRELSIKGSKLVGFGITANRKGMLFTADSDSSLTAWTLPN